MALPFLAGQRLTAADLNTATQQSAWTSYAPTWSSAGTAPAIGNGTIVGRYSKVGRIVTVSFALTAGSTTTFGTGSWSFLSPTAISGTGFVSGIAMAIIGATSFYGAAFNSGANAIQFLFGNNVAASVTTPGSWTTGSQLLSTFTYESTS